MASVIREYMENGVLTLTVVPERLTDEVQVDAWRDEMANAIRDTSPTGVILDMKSVEYMTSVAMFPLIATRRVAEEAGARLVLCNLSDAVARALTVSQLLVESRDHGKRLTMAEDRDDAIRMLSS